jgi:hypothetical protein
MAELRKPGIRALTLWTLGGVGVLLLVLLLSPWLFTKIATNWTTPNA